MAFRPESLDRLKSTLLTSGLQQKDQPLFQVINQLIDALREGINLAITSAGSGGPPSVSIPGTTINHQHLMLGGFGEYSEETFDGFPGNAGIAGVAGAAGRPGQTWIALDGEDGLEGFPTPSMPGGNLYVYPVETYPLNDLGNAGTAITIDWAVSDKQKILLNSASPCVITMINPHTGEGYVLLVEQSAGGTITWPASIIWPSGVAPTITPTPGRVDLFTFMYMPAISKYLGSFNQDYSI